MPTSDYTLQDSHPDALYVVTSTTLILRTFYPGSIHRLEFQPRKVMFLTVCTQTGRRHLRLSPAPSLASLTLYQSFWSLSIAWCYCPGRLHRRPSLRGPVGWVLGAKDLFWDFFAFTRVLSNFSSNFSSKFSLG